MFKTACSLMFVFVLSLVARAGADVKVDSSLFGALEARAIGPAVMSGRIAAVDAVSGNRTTIYVGAAGGGVWKSVNDGTTFKPVFDKYTQSIGAIAIDRSNPDVVWVGTGEAWTRNSVSIGTGVYKTTDGGDNWKYVGLKETERMSKILIDPTNSDTVYVCATGHLWNANKQRGVFKTTDGGKTWEKVLYIDPDTGCGDMAMDPQDTRILYASTWQFRRSPDFFESGGPGSGLYKSADAGKTWRKLTNGLPTGKLGRIAIAVAPTRPSVVYANVESEKTALYRSEDLGESWVRAGSTSAVEARPFYFSLLVADPVDYKRIYKPASMTSVSTDGGETWSGLTGGLHPDHHAMWINPKNPDHLMIGTDGGLYISRDRGAHFIHVASLPVSQFYHVDYDMEDPYNVYGGLQDNGTWMGPSRTASGIQNKHWDNVGFGDGFQAHVDKSDSDIVYVEWQGGRIQRVRKSTLEARDIQPLPGEGEPKYRFNWNTPIHLSPNRNDTLYIGAQFLFRTRNRGETWEKISPDLTTNDPKKQRQIDSGGLTPDNSTAENYCTIYAISESPRDENVIWVGTDDGNLQVTRDGGKNWTNVIGNVPGLPPHMWVTYVEAGRHADGVAYVTFDGHRNGVMTPYVFKTTDFGKTWVSLVTDAVEGYALCIREDLVSPNLLFLGTEFGLYATLDGGSQWARFKGKLPKVGVRDMVIHPREHDLILATHGRGIYIVDDISTLRHLSEGALESDVAMLPSRPTKMLIPAGAQEFPGDDQFVGANPASGARITYYLKRRHLFGDLKVEVLAKDGTVLKTLPGGKRKGINRVSWNMRKKGPKVAPAASLVPQMWSFFGPQVAEGDYTVRLTKGKKTYEGKIRLVMDPRADYTAKGRALQDQTVSRLYTMVERLTYVVDSLLDAKKQAEKAMATATPGGDAAKALQAFIGKLEAFRKTLVATRKGGFLAGEEQLREHLTSLYGSVNGYEGRPTDSQLSRMEVLDKTLRDSEAKQSELLGSALEELNNTLQTGGLDKVKALTHDAWRVLQRK